MNPSAGFIPDPPAGPPQDPPQEPPGAAADIAAALTEQGWCVTDGFVSPLLVSQLRHEAQARWQKGEFRRAGVGRGADLEVRPEVRTDRVLWLDPAALTGAQRCYWDALEAVRLAVNQAMYLGLHELEAHFAVYPPGSYYRRHLDQFRGIGRRRLSCILYLNDDWQAADGGALRIYTEPVDADRGEAGVASGDCVEVLPLGGRFVTFLSARFLHEVLPARRERFSLTGWLLSR
ncbi:2OG-Fe(II) oxygenase [Thiohalocapsa sp. ML1]|uniref:2OG-Fe(II) oxygenase n=1 Tax=Thiohalocapsa sp. ML1 TaxID=1431688 RepID=UPI0020B14DE7|nr:2OG-Fe(II) oxygenase [Thiohalocapsa sp. ML1]